MGKIFWYNKLYLIHLINIQDIIKNSFMIKVNFNAIKENKIAILVLN